MQGYAKPLVFTAALLPFAWLVVLALGNGLGANPAEALIRATGDWTLRFLCLTLAITPLRILTRTPELARFRRMLGLFVYFYASVHLLCYSGFDQGFELGDIATDIAKRPFILVGLLAFAILTALAATSPQRALRWLGGKRWQQLHRWVYVVAVLAVLHFYWMRAGKSNFAEVWLYGGILAVLLGWRVLRAWQKLRA